MSTDPQGSGDRALDASLVQLKQFVIKHWLTAFGVLVCTVVFLLWQVLPTQQLQGFFMPNKTSDGLTLEVIARSFPPSIGHSHLSHFAMNMFGWIFLASRIEERTRLDIILVFISASFAGNLLQYTMQGPFFLGLSGVIYGLGAYALAVNSMLEKDLIPIQRSLLYFLMISLAVMFMGLVPNVANYAHGGGALAGATVGFLRVGYFRLINQRAS